MFRLCRIKDVVRIPPDRFGEPLESVARDELRNRYEGKVDSTLGLVITIASVEVDPEGFILQGDGATYHNVIADLLTYYPVLNEVTLGEVVDVKKIGMYVNIGPIDAFVHVSQILDDKVFYDELQDVLVGEESKKTFRKGDTVRGRIVSVSINAPTSIRVAMTLRQPYLGRVEGE
ncbi:MAG: DNA-directed RNA polymerase [Sulfolobales archaeon]